MDYNFKTFGDKKLLDLRHVTDDDVQQTIIGALKNTSPETHTWRILSSALLLSEHYSFTATRTYPRPDHPDPAKRKPLIFLLVGILVSLRTTLENEQRAMAEVIKRFPTVDSLQCATAQEIADAIRPAGMANRRAKQIRVALDYVEEHFNGGLESLSLLTTVEARNTLLSIPGIGPKSADCVLSIGLGKPSIAVDVNVFRVTSWLFALPWARNPDYRTEQHVSQVKELLDLAMPSDAFICQIVHTLFLLYGKAVGSKHPTFDSCLIQRYCLSCVEP
jgi:endonuclease III